MIASAIAALLASCWERTPPTCGFLKKFKKCTFGTSRRCYNVGVCFNDKASSASKAVLILCYDEANYSEDQYVFISAPSCQLKFASVDLDSKVSTFTLWEYGNGRYCVLLLS